MLELLFSPDGYIHRMRFLIGHIALVILVLLVMFGYLYILPHFATTFGISAADLTNSFADILRALEKDTIPMPAWSKPTAVVYISGGIIIAFLVWSNLCLILKRVRDLDVSLWFAIFPTGIFTYLISFVMLVTKSSNQTMILISQICVITQILSMITLLLYPSRLNLSEEEEEDDDDDNNND